MSRRLGWCLDGHHGEPGRRRRPGRCPGKVGDLECSCTCHDPVVLSDVQAYARTRTEAAS